MSGESVPAATGSASGLVAEWVLVAVSTWVASCEARVVAGPCVALSAAVVLEATGEGAGEATEDAAGAFGGGVVRPAHPVIPARMIEAANLRTAERSHGTGRGSTAYRPGVRGGVVAGRG